MELGIRAVGDDAEGGREEVRPLFWEVVDSNLADCVAEADSVKATNGFLPTTSSRWSILPRRNLYLSIILWTQCQVQQNLSQLSAGVF